MKPETKQLLVRAIKSYGNIHQIVKAMEEMDELGKELCKVLCLRESQTIPDDLHDHIAEEMADVMIMMAQLELIFNNSRAVKWHMDRKLKRLEGRIDERVKHSA